MTRLEIQTQALAILQANLSGVDGGGVWGQTEILRYLTDSEMKLFVMIAAAHENFFRTTTTLSEVAGTATINLPTNTYRLLRLERIVGFQSSTTNPIPLIPVDRNDGAIDFARGARYPFNYDGTTSYPQYYQMHGQKQIELMPTPSLSATDSLRLSYIARPAAMAGDTHVPFQITAGTGGAGTDNLVEFHDILVLAVVEKCFLKEESYAQADRYKALRLEREAELMKYLTSTQVQVTRGINVSHSEWDW